MKKKNFDRPLLGLCVVCFVAAIACAVMKMWWAFVVMSILTTGMASAARLKISKKISVKEAIGMGIVYSLFSLVFFITLLAVVLGLLWVLFTFLNWVTFSGMGNPIAEMFRLAPFALWQVIAGMISLISALVVLAWK